MFVLIGGNILIFQSEYFTSNKLNLYETLNFLEHIHTKKDSNSSPLIKISDNIYLLDNIYINSETKEIHIPGIVNLQRGMIELAACADGGKLHESIFLLNIVPYYLHVALLLIGLDYKGGVEYQGDSTTPQGDSLEIYVMWKYNGLDTVVRLEDCIWDIKNNQTMQHTCWIFSGSKIINGKYMADVERSIITTYHDPYTIIDNPLSTGSDDEVYRINDKLVPSKGTAVKLILKKYK
ncbi:MAG: hypothetical protein IGBAC_1444 [Ignavibacteriae bacterium]|nr:MAG: hypothetical protein IGBAC_1444 [Ignavibacteriota bacterium]